MVNFDKLRNIITSKVSAGIEEGEYTSWTHKWTNTLSATLFTCIHLDVLVDDKNDKIIIGGYDSNSDARFGIFNVSDFSQVFMSPSGGDYTHYSPETYYKEWFAFGAASYRFGSQSRSIQTYLLLLRNDEKTLEVWRDGSSWSRDIQNDEAGVTVSVFLISPTGKYLLVVTKDQKIMLYEGT